MWLSYNMIVLSLFYLLLSLFDFSRRPTPDSFVSKFSVKRLLRSYVALNDERRTIPWLAGYLGDAKTKNRAELSEIRDKNIKVVVLTASPPPRHKAPSSRPRFRSRWKRLPPHPHLDPLRIVRFAAVVPKERRKTPTIFEIDNKKYKPEHSIASPF
jgi:hypothetical protein